jgi:hypothetical protein
VIAEPVTEVRAWRMNDKNKAEIAEPVTEVQGLENE